MMENDEQLIEEFLAPARQEIADNGFSRNVMHRLPTRSNHLARLLNVVTFALSLIIFTLLDGWQRLWSALYETMKEVWTNGVAEADPINLLLVVGVLFLVGYQQIASHT